MYDQLILRINVATVTAATIIMKYILTLLYADPFLYFKENIGISLIIRRARTTEATGMSCVS